MAGTVPTITPNSITGINGLTEKPIYFVKLNGAPNATIVIKGEGKMREQQDDNDALVSISWSSKIMKNVNHRSVNCKIMNQAEINEFMRAARAAFAPNSNQAVLLDMPFNWVKMPKVEDLSDTEYYVRSDAYTGDSGVLIKKTIKMLSEDAAWYELGKVVAVDVFNGNNDRFDIRTGEWVNQGNIMFTGKTVIGLDTFDPSGTNFGAMTSNLVRGGGYEELRALTDPNRMRQFAQSCTIGVGHQLFRALRNLRMSTLSVKMPDGTTASIALSEVERLFTPYAGEFERGLRDGAATLKTYLQRKVQEYNQGFNVTHTQQQRGNVTMGGNRGVQGNQNTGSGLKLGLQRGVHQPQQQQPQGNRKHIPQGILDRMQFLGWL